jgi:hypothetical protein
VGAGLHGEVSAGDRRSGGRGSRHCRIWGRGQLGAAWEAAIAAAKEAGTTGFWEGPARGDPPRRSHGKARANAVALT